MKYVETIKWRNHAWTLFLNVIYKNQLKYNRDNDTLSLSLANQWWIAYVISIVYSRVMLSVHPSNLIQFPLH